MTSVWKIVIFPYTESKTRQGSLPDALLDSIERYLSIEKVDAN